MTYGLKKRFFIRFIPAVLFAVLTLSGHPSGADSIRPWISICSDLDFHNIKWPSSLSSGRRVALALALNITGSYEGQKGWDNLTNNFDGQGFSMGLLNQNLGQGSLQPMMIEMQRRFESSMRAQFTTRNYLSLSGMLKQWRSYQNSSETQLLQSHGFNRLDDPEDVARILGISPWTLTPQNQESVNWAKANVLTGINIRSDWANQLSDLAVTSGYRSLQVEQALALHDAAMALLNEYHLQQLRSYLFFFDIMVQNGGIPDVDKTDYRNYLRWHPWMSETSKLKKILELRLRHVKSQYVDDVRRRKTALIDGTGLVHHKQRDFNREYCTDLRQAMP